ncbi:hypothetical protein ADL27_58870, partial [Streptomyces sp. NRRL F-6602]
MSSLHTGAVPLNLPGMAAAQGHLSDGTDGTDGTEGARGPGAGADDAPPGFRAAGRALEEARLRPEIEVEAT